MTVLRAATCDARAALPDALWDLPVTALGTTPWLPAPPRCPARRWRSPAAPPAAPTGQPPPGGADLPPALERIGDYAFLNCGALRRLDLHDSVRQWGGGA